MRPFSSELFDGKHRTRCVENHEPSIRTKKNLAHRRNLFQPNNYLVDAFFNGKMDQVFSRKKTSDEKMGFHFNPSVRYCFSRILKAFFRLFNLSRGGLLVAIIPEPMVPG